MKKILLCLCFVFAVGLLFSACGKDDEKTAPVIALVPVANLPTQTVAGHQINLDYRFGYSKEGRVIQSNQTISVRRNVGIAFDELIKIDGEQYNFNESYTELEKSSDESITFPATGVIKWYVSMDGSSRGDEVTPETASGYFGVDGRLKKFNGNMPTGGTITVEFSLTSFNGRSDSPLPMVAYIILKVIE